MNHSDLTQPDLLSWAPPPPQSIMGDRDGYTFDRKMDLERCNNSMGRIFRFLGDGEWRVPRELADAGGCSESAATARHRDLSKAKFGAWPTECRRFGKGLWKYRRVIKP